MSIANSKYARVASIKFIKIVFALIKLKLLLKAFLHFCAINSSKFFSKHQAEKKVKILSFINQKKC